MKRLAKRKEDRVRCAVAENDQAYAAIKLGKPVAPYKRERLFCIAKIGVMRTRLQENLNAFERTKRCFGSASSKSANETVCTLNRWKKLLFSKM